MPAKSILKLYNDPMPFELMFPAVDMSFDPETDIQETEQFGFVKLTECYDKGIIPGTLASSELEFNGVTDPETLMPRAHDWAERQRQAQYVKEQLVGLSSKERSAVEKSVEAAQSAVSSQAGAPVTSGEN